MFLTQLEGKCSYLPEKKGAGMAIRHQIKARYLSRNDEIVAGLRDAAHAVAPLDPKMVVKRKAAEISTAMALLHGGDWRVQIDHREGLVLIVRRRHRGTP